MSAEPDTAQHPTPAQMWIALMSIRDHLYVDEDDTGELILDPAREWGTEELELIADTIQDIMPLTARARWCPSEPPPAWTTTRVVIRVQSGCAESDPPPPGVEIEIRDYDGLSDIQDMQHDSYGCYESTIYTPEA